MGSLISASDKADMESAIMDVFDTFKRPLVVYRTPEKIILSTNSNYSRFGQRDQNVFMPEVEPIIDTIYACILYADQMRKSTSIPLGGGEQNSAQLKLLYPEGQVRIKVKSEDFSIINGAKIIELDGYNFEIDTTPRPHGLFGTGLYTFFLKRV